MADQTIKKPIVINKWLGMYSSLPSHLIPDFYVANSMNMSFVSVGYINPFPFYSLFLTHTVSGSFVTGVTFKKPDGTEIPLLHFDTGAKCTLYWYNSVGNKLEILVDNLTTGERMAFSGSGYNTETSDGIYFCDGVMNYSFWNGGSGSIASNNATTITLNEDATTAGFTASGSVIINGTTYTYSGRSGSTLTGLTGLPTFTANTGVAQLPDTSTYSSLPKFHIMWVQDGRVWGVIKNSILVSYSQVGVATNFTAGNNPDDPGSFDVIEGTGPITAGGAFKDYSVIFKQDLAKYYKIVYPSNTTKTRDTDIIRQGDDAGCAGPDALLNLDDRVYYVSPKGGIRWVGRSSDYDGFTFDDFTNTIRPTLKDGVFTSSKLSYYEKERVLVATYRSSSDVAKDDRQITVEFTEDDALAKIRPVSQMDWPIAFMFKYGGNMYFASNLEEKVYKMFDGYTKDNAPALSLVTLKRYAFGNRYVRTRCEWIGVRGRMADGQKLYFILSYDRDGGLKTLEGTLEYDEDGFFTQGDIHIIGRDAIGTEPIGGNLDDVEELNAFQIFFDLPSGDFPYDMELTIYNEGINSNKDVVGSRYTIEDVGFMVMEDNLNKDKYRSKPFNKININDY